MFGTRATNLDRGLDAFEQRRWKHARRLLEAALDERASAAGAYHLGLLYWRGLGGEPAPEQAAACFAKAADAGHVAAQSAYGVALSSGIGVAMNAERAYALFRAAAGAGDCAAMVQLASLSAGDEARHWLERASGLGHCPAMTQLADAVMERDPVTALAWLYAAVALCADEAARRRATALAREMSASEIAAAQKAGKAEAAQIKGRARGRR